MEIIVKKPTESERADMRKKPVWECGVSEFDWHYSSQEICLVIEGEVTVEYDTGKNGGGSVSFGAGDYVVFPKGLSCVWKVTKPVKKHYLFK